MLLGQRPLMSVYLAEGIVVLIYCYRSCRRLLGPVRPQSYTRSIYTSQHHVLEVNNCFLAVHVPDVCMETTQIRRAQQPQVRRANQTNMRFSSDVRPGERGGERGGRRGRQQRGATPIIETEVFSVDDARYLLKVRA